VIVSAGGGAHSTRATRALQKLSETDPAFAALALWCAHRDAPGAADGPPAWTDGETIYYGPGYEALNDGEQVGCAAHHILHVAFRHVPRGRAMKARLGRSFDADLYGLATDALINESLQLAGYALPRPAPLLTGLLKESLGEEVTPDQAVATWDADKLYVRIQQGGEGPGQAARSSRGSSSGAASSGPAGKSPASAATDYGKDQGYRPDMALEEGPAAGTEEEEDSHAEEEWRQRVARAMEAGRLAGTGSGVLGHRIEDLPAQRTPWEVRLRGMVTRAVTRKTRVSVSLIYISEHTRPD